MFTGLVREVGRIARVARHAGITTLDIEAPLTARPAGAAPPAVGDSLAVNGICLTLVRIAGTRVSVEATAETRRVTTLGEWRAGTPVHLEPSLRVGDQIGGHFVLGHVDGTGRLAALEQRAGAAWMTVTLGRDLARRLLPKGSIAVDGVSLTLDEGPFDAGFTVTLIPHTLRATRFAALGPGAKVNLELDILTKAASTLRQAQGVSTRAVSDTGPAAPELARRRAVQRGASEGGRLTMQTILASGWGKGIRHG